MTTPTQADLSAPPGGGAGATVIVPPATPPVTPPAATGDELKLEPGTPPTAPATTLAAPSAPAAATVPDFGDPGLNVAADYFVNTLGLPLDSPELTEAANGNYTYLEAKIAQLGDKAKGADRFITLAKEAMTRVKTTETAKHEAAVKTVHEAVGGADNWKAVQNFARANLSADQLSEASAALTQGGLAATAMARHLMAMASQNPQATVTGQEAITPAAPGVSLTAHAPLTREQYRAEYRKLVAEYGITGAQKRPELAQLNARVIR